MSNVNHRILKRFDITLAAIEGTEVRTLCGDTFVPTVQVGTSGRFDDPVGDLCPDCEGLVDLIHEKWEAKQRLGDAERAYADAQNAFRLRLDEARARTKADSREEVAT